MTEKSSSNTATLRSVQVGMPHSYGDPDANHPMNREWRTGYFKSPTDAPIMLRRLNLDGDGQGDLKHHGGPDKAVCVYPFVHYAYWNQRLDRTLPQAAFGENFTVKGQDEDSVCIGDIFRVGDAVVEVTQPRSPCWKLSRRWGIKRLALWVQQTGFTGWYLRVLEEGAVQAGQSIVLEERPSEQWTIRAANNVRYKTPVDTNMAAELAACPALSDGWTTKMKALSEAGKPRDERRRLIGDNE